MAGGIGTGIDIFDAAGRPIDDFTTVSGSATPHGPQGLQIAAVPEPTTTALLVIGLEAAIEHASPGVLDEWRRCANQWIATGLSPWVVTALGR